MEEVAEFHWQRLRPRTAVAFSKGVTGEDGLLHHDESELGELGGEQEAVR